jgi:predicted PurR-regulated permease PerM
MNGHSQGPSRDHSRRDDILFTFVLAFSLYLAWLLREVLMLFYVSALFAVVLTPVIRAISQIKIGRWSPGRGMSVLILFVVSGTALSLFFLFALPPVIRDLQEFVHELPTRGPQVIARIKSLPFTQRLNIPSLNGKLQDLASNFATYLLFSVKDWAGKLFDLIMGIVLTIYFMLEGEETYQWFLKFIPARIRFRLDQTLQRAEVRMGKWLAGQLLLMLILGISSTIVFFFLKVRYAYALGVIMGLFNIVPVAGALISMALVVLAAAIDSWGRVLGVLIFYAIYAQVETSYLTPRIMKTRVDLAGLAVIVALMLGSKLAGILGAMVSVPTAVLIAVLLDEYMVDREPMVTPISESKSLARD